MRVVLLSDCLPPVRNGVAHHVQMLARGLARAGVQVRVVAPGPAHDDDGPEVVRYPGIALGATGYAAGWPRDPALWRLLTEADLLHTHHPFLSGAVAARAAAQSGAPLLFTSHTRYDLYLDAYVPWLPPQLAQSGLRIALRRLGNRCATVIAPGAGAVEALSAWGVRAPVEVIANGIDLARFAGARLDPTARQATRSALGLAPDDCVALYVGRLSSEKRVLPLLASFAAARRAGATCRLLLVGDGAQAADVRAAIDALGVAPGVTLAGSRAYAEMPALYVAADFFVSASVSETHPLTFLEAAAAGLPALGYDAPGVRDIVVDGVCGLLAPWTAASQAVADPHLVVRWLALAGNASLRARLGTAAAAAAQAWSADTTAARVLALYNRTLAQVQGRGKQKECTEVY